ncbi:4-(cytidine 5'-diphospho)-2-C-methyl-D-erythritol kinase [Salinispora tropica]|uniref:4-diphosphocytidyl-2-C-methyl-D-erythritol kinase n=1 Tax=Salinispora tropica (strain ATCC BAA-916 / DSM 44818 / JCM 13857 / NBRC 105044 / CNB-440) TaxID=369723 RepID=ISPE_SALTO|nr:4-(cytidine 5'-diphospho)-2-C-methyl-D-erythritol kinase [Salinispora tropica]A4X310.1 RecName: Full=4-diphosphocytidyl-2-C-methyl-D-erythritol kinase; Short=CMK; AltName: Full=4-(cytidine-5'-diphospho)-2-C-methyl-D-erythritol kinase [Salinispora tropica CNB-440]ABP53260.1 4-diphosphocytidyl-2-C-methyl-D-erythritol kinase [Salinispora tropica CNB-440]
MTEAWRPEDDEPRGASGPVRVRVPAKINLHLGVGPLRRDGYHELNTVYHAISIHDELTARRGDTLTLTMEGEGAGELALDESNLVIRAARALAGSTGVPPHARLHLRKQIPLAGGLAGGSADAAAALVACDALWGTGLTRDELAEIAAGLGSDVPFLIHGGTALGTGRGEAVSPVLARPTVWHWVVAVADGGLSTPVAYRELDRLRAAGAAGPPLGSTDTLLAALRQPDPRVLAAALGNDLQDAALALRPALAATLKAGEAAGALAGIVSGSGPTCVFLAAGAADAERIAAELSALDVCRQARTAHGPVAGARIG